MIKRSLTELLEYFIFPMMFWSSHTKNVSYIRWIHMWMQFSIASWKENYFNSKTHRNYFNGTKVEFITYETVYLHSLISNGCLFPPLPLLSMLFSFLTNEAIITI